MKLHHLLAALLMLLWLAIGMTAQGTAPIFQGTSTPDPRHGRVPRFEPGTLAFFAYDANGDRNLWLLDGNTGARRVLVHFPVPEFDFGPLGTRLTFDPARQQLVMSIREGGSISPPGAIVGVTARGQLTRITSVDPAHNSALGHFAPTGDGNIYVGVSAQELRYVDASDTQLALLDQAGLPVYAPWGMTSLYYDPATNCLLAAAPESSGPPSCQPCMSTMTSGSFKIVKYTLSAMDPGRIVGLNEQIYCFCYAFSLTQLSKGPAGSLLVSAQGTSPAGSCAPRLLTLDPNTLLLSEFTQTIPLSPDEDSYVHAMGYCAAYDFSRGMAATLSSRFIVGAPWTRIDSLDFYHPTPGQCDLPDARVDLGQVWGGWGGIPNALVIIP